jgi:hypothetical protein
MMKNEQNQLAPILQISRSFQLWLLAIARPAKVFSLKSSPDELSISLWILFFFSRMYSFTSLILYYVGVFPAVDQWLPDRSPSELDIAEREFTLKAQHMLKPPVDPVDIRKCVSLPKIS